jgi:hypothetical protein
MKDGDWTDGQMHEEGCGARLSIWKRPTDIIYGTIAQPESLASSLERMLGGERKIFVKIDFVNAPRFHVNARYR